MDIIWIPLPKHAALNALMIIALNVLLESLLENAQHVMLVFT